jgi:hypothetical protein
VITRRRILGWCLWVLTLSLAVGLLSSSAAVATSSPLDAASPATLDPPLGRSAPAAAIVPGATPAPGSPSPPTTTIQEGTTPPAGTTTPQGTTAPLGTTSPSPLPGMTVAPTSPTTPAPPAKKPPPAARIAGPASPPLPPSFVGLSVETSLVTSWFSPAGCHSPVQQALAMLGRPEVRVGGNSQDRLWPTAPLPPGESQVAGTSYLHALHCLGAVGSPLLVGLNLLGDNAAATGQVLGEVASVVPAKQLTVALGNEPDQYGGRLPGGFAAFVPDYEQMRAALRAGFGEPLPQIAGPDPSTSRWIAQTASFIATEHPNVADEHVYGLNGCHRTLGSPNYPSIRHLLAAGSSTKLIAALDPVLAAARAANIRAQISEANSVACGGMPGISDSRASALWGLDLVDTAAQAGFSHIELHSSGGSYDPLVIAPDGTITFRPLWTAMYLADQLWPNGSVPLRLTGKLQAGLTGWVARRPDGSLAVLLVNGNVTRSRRLVLATPAATATVGRIVRAGAQAVTLDGQQLAWSHGAPVWKGTQHLTSPKIKKDRLAVTLAPESAAWIVLGKGALPTT